jgi:hypothetical protein
MELRVERKFSEKGKEIEEEKLLIEELKRNRRENKNIKENIRRKEEKAKRRKEDEENKIKRIEERKLKKKELNAKRSCQINKNNSKNTKNNSNDKDKFFDNYDYETNMEICAVCLFEGGMNCMILIDINIKDYFITSGIQAEFNSYLNEVVLLKCDKMFVEDIKSEVNEYGVFKYSNYICNKCKNQIRTKTKSSKKDNSNNDSENNSDKDEFVEGEDDLNENENLENINNNISQTLLHGTIPDNYFLYGLYNGKIPNELKGLTFIENSMISIYNPITKVQIEGNNNYYYYFIMYMYILYMYYYVYYIILYIYKSRV